MQKIALNDQINDRKRGFNATFLHENGRKKRPK